MLPPNSIPMSQKKIHDKKQKIPLKNYSQTSFIIIFLVFRFYLFNHKPLFVKEWNNFPELFKFIQSKNEDFL